MAPVSHRPKILFFVDGMVPSDLDKAEAETLVLPPYKVSFRNAQKVDADSNPEHCDFVAGVVPPNYAHFPRAEPVDGSAATPVPSAPQAAPVAPTPVPPVASRGRRSAVAQSTAPKNDGWGSQ